MNSSPTRYRCWLTTPSFCNPKRNPMIPLEQKLLDLNLTVMRHRLETTLSEAAGKNLSAAATLEWLADMELEARHGRAIERRFKCSKLQAQPSIDAFHFSHHKSRSQNKNRILRLLDLNFIENGTNLVLIGNPGVGKTFLSKIVGLPKSPSGAAVRYALNQWQALTRFLQDGELEIDNGATERANRDIALGRGNWTFFGSDSGGKTAAVLRSFVASCKRNGVEPFAWFRDVLSRLRAHPINRIAELL